MVRSLFATLIVRTLVWSPICNAQLPSYGWAQEFEDYTDDTRGQVALDNEGAIYWTSNFIGTVDIDPGPGVVTLTAPGGGGAYEGEAFVAKFSAQGEFLWRVFLNTNGNTINIGEIAINDALGELVIVGGYRGNLTVEPGPGAMGNSTTRRPFILKYDLEGNYIDHMTLTVAASAGLNFASVAYATDGGLLIGGDVYGTVDIDPVGVTNAVGGNWTAFVAKYDYPFDLAWGFTLDGSIGSAVADVAQTADGGILITGGIVGSAVDFDPGPGASTVAANAPYTHAFIARYTAQNALEWVYAFGNTATRSRGYSVLQDAAGGAYMLGTYDMPNAGGIFDLDPGAGTNLMPDVNDDLGVVVKFTAEGAYAWGYGYSPNEYGDVDYATGHTMDQLVLFGASDNVTLLYAADVPVVQEFDCNAVNPFCLGLDTDGNVLWYAIEGEGCGNFHFGESIAFNANGQAAVLGYYSQSPDASYGTVADHLPDLPGVHPYLMTFSTNSTTEVAQVIPQATAGHTLFDARIVDVQGRLVHSFPTPVIGLTASDLALFVPHLNGGVYILEGIGSNGALIQQKLAIAR